MSRASPWRLAWTWGPPMLLTAVLLVLGGTADLQFAPAKADDLLIRKVGHAAAYGLLALLWHRALVTSTPWPAAVRTRWLLPLALTAAVAFADELLQSVAPGREMKASDVLLDMTGAISVLVLLRSWRLERARRSAPA